VGEGSWRWGGAVERKEARGSACGAEDEGGCSCDRSDRGPFGDHQ
jgi:hypothetical protein